MTCNTLAHRFSHVTSEDGRPAAAGLPPKLAAKKRDRDSTHPPGFLLTQFPGVVVVFICNKVMVTVLHGHGAPECCLIPRRLPCPK